MIPINMPINKVYLELTLVIERKKDLVPLFFMGRFGFPIL